MHVLNQAGGDWVPLGQRGEAAAWGTATGGKPEPHGWGALSLWFPLTALCERLWFQHLSSVVDPARELSCSTAALLVFICVAN